MINFNRKAGWLRKPKLKGYRLAKAGCRQDGRQAATKGGCH
jgi:hypothetical protein